MNARHVLHLSFLRCAKNFSMLTRRNFGHGSRLGELRRTAKTSGDSPARLLLGMGRDSTAIRARRGRPSIMPGISCGFGGGCNKWRYADLDLNWATTLSKSQRPLRTWNFGRPDTSEKTSLDSVRLFDGLSLFQLSCKNQQRVCYLLHRLGPHCLRRINFPRL